MLSVNNSTRGAPAFRPPKLLEEREGQAPGIRQPLEGLAPSAGRVEARRVGVVHQAEQDRDPRSSSVRRTTYLLLTEISFNGATPEEDMRPLATAQTNSTKD